MCLQDYIAACCGWLGFPVKKPSNMENPAYENIDDVERPLEEQRVMKEETSYQAMSTEGTANMPVNGEEKVNKRVKGLVSAWVTSRGKGKDRELTPMVDSQPQNSKTQGALEAPEQEQPLVESTPQDSDPTPLPRKKKNGKNGKNGKKKKNGTKKEDLISKDGDNDSIKGEKGDSDSTQEKNSDLYIYDNVALEKDTELEQSDQKPEETVPVAVTETESIDPKPADPKPADPKPAEPTSASEKMASMISQSASSVLDQLPSGVSDVGGKVADLFNQSGASVLEQLPADLPVPEKVAGLFNQPSVDYEEDMSLFDELVLAEKGKYQQEEEVITTGGDFGENLEEKVVSSVGSLQVSFQYDSEEAVVEVTIISLEDVPSRNLGGAAENVQIRLCLMPARKPQYKTEVKPINDCDFNTIFTFRKVQPDHMHGMGVRFRLFDILGKMNKRLLGEAIFSFGEVGLSDRLMTRWISLIRPSSDVSFSDTESVSSAGSSTELESMQSGPPELLLGLSYEENSKELNVQIIKGSNFRSISMTRAPDTYIKLSIVGPNETELETRRTTVRQGQVNPIFKENFSFKITKFNLSMLTLMVTVFHRKAMKRKELIGWCALGKNSSSEEERVHWREARQSRSQLTRWHLLKYP